MTDRRPDVPRQPRGSQLEHTTQVDPMLREGRASSWRIWSVGIAIAVVLAVVIYGIGVQHETTDSGTVTTQGQGQGAQPKE